MPVVVCGIWWHCGRKTIATEIACNYGVNQKTKQFPLGIIANTYYLKCGTIFYHITPDSFNHKKAMKIYMSRLSVEV